METSKKNGNGNGHKLPIASALRDVDVDVDAQLAEFEREERRRLGVDQADPRVRWVESMAKPVFKASERQDTTILVAGLTMAHDLFVKGALSGLGYNVETLDCPDNTALRYGKEFGNRAQCNPTYFTVGNLVKSLVELQQKNGLSTEQVIRKYIFLTAGACGPCRFGMYVTEYRKALRDAGFEGFRVMLFQQQGGFKQATGEEAGLQMNPAFFLQVTKAILAGDVLNGLAYRIRPYEVEAGATDRAMENAKRIIYDTLAAKGSILKALWRARGQFAGVEVDRLRAKPKVAIIGEFWAMTTEGDGNYQLQRFLESEGAEVDIQFVSAWLLFMLWEQTHDTRARAVLRGVDGGRKGLAGKDVAKKLAMLWLGERVVRAAFQLFAHTIGLYDYVLPDMHEIAAISNRYYNNELRGGEGHMEVGKLIQNTVKEKATMTVSVKPFGCMPSAGVSDGVQSAVTERFPGTIFCAVETSGDGRVNFYSRVQMFLFKARLAAQEELSKALADTGVTEEQLRRFLEQYPWFGRALHKAPHKVASTAADFVYEVAPYLGKSRLGVYAGIARRVSRMAIDLVTKHRTDMAIYEPRKQPAIVAEPIAAPAAAPSAAPPRAVATAATATESPAAA